MSPSKWSRTPSRPPRTPRRPATSPARWSFVISSASYVPRPNVFLLDCDAKAHRTLRLGVSIGIGINHTCGICGKSSTAVKDSPVCRVVSRRLVRCQNRAHPGYPFQASRLSGAIKKGRGCLQESAKQSAYGELAARLSSLGRAVDPAGLVVIDGLDGCLLSKL